MGILHFGEFPGASGERIFLVRLDAAPEGDDVSYEYGLGVAIDGQPQSTPNPTALAGFGRVALSRLWVIEVGGEFLGLDPAASYSRVETVATGVVFKNLVVFRVPDAELGEGKFYLQSFGRQGDTAESPAGFSIVDGDLAS